MLDVLLSVNDPNSLLRQSQLLCSHELFPPMAEKRKAYFVVIWLKEN